MSLGIFIVFLAISYIQSQLTSVPPISCPNSQALCGGRVCYNPATQRCTEFDTVVQCIAVCGNQCYNPSIHKCFNGTVCSLEEELCVVKYDSGSGVQYNQSYYQCYNPAYQACFYDTLCSFPSRTCNRRCLGYNQVCVNDMTVCNVTSNYYYYQADQIKLCNDVCYDSATQTCTNLGVRCISSNCSGTCYNLSLQQCFNNTLCNFPSRTCNQRCLGDNQVCVNNMTVCNATSYYNIQQADQIRSCGGVCYDSATQICTSLGIRCISSNCSGTCYSSSSQQCLNGTVCNLGQQLCLVKYDRWSGFQYNPSYYQCYQPTYQSCVENALCYTSSELCNQRCLRYDQVCVDNTTVCNVTRYHNYQVDQIKLCNGVCYDSTTQRCLTGYNISNLTTHSSTATMTTGIITTARPTTRVTTERPTTERPTTRVTTERPTTRVTTQRPPTAITTTASSISSSCCLVKDCTSDADCCVPGIECQCFRRDNQTLGSCMNPYVQPICANGCPNQSQCRNNTDCCKCQCGQITVTNTDGNRVTKAQCVPR